MINAHRLLMKINTIRNIEHWIEGVRLFSALNTNSQKTDPFFKTDL